MSLNIASRESHTFSERSAILDDTKPGVGVMLSTLREMGNKVLENNPMYECTQDRKVKGRLKGTITSTERIIKKGDTFYYNKIDKRCFCEAYDFTFRMKRLQDQEKRINFYTKKEKKDLTLQDYSDLARKYILQTSGENRETDTLVDAHTLGYQQSEPFECAYVICPRKASFDDLILALHKHIERKQVFVDPNDYYVWIDIFCSRAIQDKKEYGKEELKESLEKLRRKIGKFDEVVLFLDNLTNPIALTRLWCTWEFYVAAVNATKVVGAAPDATIVPFSIISPKRIPVDHDTLLNFEILLMKIDAIDVNKLETKHVNLEKLEIEKLFFIVKGTEHVLKTIKAALCTWLTTTVLRAYKMTYNINASFINKTSLFFDLVLFLTYQDGDFSENENRLLAETSKNKALILNSEYLTIKEKLADHARVNKNFGTTEGTNIQFLDKNLREYAKKFKVACPQEFPKPTVTTKLKAVAKRVSEFGSGTKKEDRVVTMFKGELHTKNRNSMKGESEFVDGKAAKKAEKQKNVNIFYLQYLIMVKKFKEAYKFVRNVHKHLGIAEYPLFGSISRYELLLRYGEKLRAKDMAKSEYTEFLAYLTEDIKKVEESKVLDQYPEFLRRLNFCLAIFESVKSEEVAMKILRKEFVFEEGKGFMGPAKIVAQANHFASCLNMNKNKPYFKIRLEDMKKHLYEKKVSVKIEVNRDEKKTALVTFEENLDKIYTKPKLV